MLVSSDISPEWSPPDVALCVGLVAKIHEVIRAVVTVHGRKLEEPVVQDLIAKAQLIAFKSEHIYQGFRIGDLGHAFIEIDARLRAERIDLADMKKTFMEGMTYGGRA